MIKLMRGAQPLLLILSALVPGCLANGGSGIEIATLVIAIAAFILVIALLIWLCMRRNKKGATDLDAQYNLVGDSRENVARDTNTACSVIGIILLLAFIAGVILLILWATGHL